MNVPAPENHVGRVVDGRYRIEYPLGSGGMGVVFVAEHLYTRRKVALKLLHADRSEEPTQMRARFLAEARTATAVRHPNVVDVLDMGTDEYGMPFLVMELLDGMSLEHALVQQRVLEPVQTLAWLIPIVGALATLHDAGIVHRDVKPSNIFLSTSPRGVIEPKLLDFGLARVLSDSRLTRSGVVIGTPMYMAPEHAGGLTVGPQSDIWSLGVVLFECVTGQPPFSSREGAAIAAQVLAGHTRSVQSVRPEVPKALAEAIERALRRDLSQRYREMRDLAKGLLAGALASGIPVPPDPDPVGLPEFRAWCSDPLLAATTHASENRARTPLPVPPPSPLAPQPSTARSGERARQRPTHARLWGIALALLGLAALIWWLQGDTPDRPTNIATPAMIKTTEPAWPAVSTPTNEGKVEPAAAEPPPRVKPSAAPERIGGSGSDTPRPAGERRRPRRPTTPQAQPSTSTPVSQPRLEVEPEWK